MDDSTFSATPDRVGPAAGIPDRPATDTAVTEFGVMIYTAMDGWRRHMVHNGAELLGAALELAHCLRADIDGLDGLHVVEAELLGREASHDLDRLQTLVDVSALGISGYQAADWLREHCRIDVGLSDHRRIDLTLSMADNPRTAERALNALTELTKNAGSLPAPAPVDLPDPAELELESVHTPRDAFFGPTEMVPAGQADGRIAAEQITPYPPGIPAIVPGERINTAVINYLRSGLHAGMVLPDATDPTLDTVRVSTHSDH